MRLELQFSFCFLTDYLAAKIIGLIASKLPVGTMTPIGTFVNYVPQASPTIFNRRTKPGVVAVPLALFLGIDPLELELSASTSNGLEVTVTLADPDHVRQQLSQLGVPIDPNLISNPFPVPVDLSSISIIGPGLQDPTKAGFAARTDASVVALRVELGDVGTADSGAWTAFLNNQAFTPAFQPADISVDPPREWAVLVDWEIVKPGFAMELEPQVKSTATTSNAFVTGDFVYAWGLAYGDQHSGFSGAWPFDSNGAFDLDATCPVDAQGHDGSLYLQIGFSAKGRNTLHSHVQIGAQVSCVWQDVNPVDHDDPFGPFDFDGNFLHVDAVSTDARGMVVRGEALLHMPLAFPVPGFSVGNFTWIFEDACDTRALAQVVGVSLFNSKVGFTTPLRGSLTVDAPFPYKVESIPAVDAQGIGTAPLFWTVTIPPGSRGSIQRGRQVTLSVDTNAGSNGPWVLRLAPLLTDAEILQMETKAVAMCEGAKHVGYKKKFVPEPPEEIIWWVTQELLLVPSVTRAGAPMAVAGPVTRVAVPKSGLAAAIRQQKKNPHGILQRHSIGQDGIRVVVSRVEQLASSKTRVSVTAASVLRSESKGSQRRST